MKLIIKKPSWKGRWIMFRRSLNPVVFFGNGFVLDVPDEHKAFVRNLANEKGQAHPEEKP
jgi:hypothetical protein